MSISVSTRMALRNIHRNRRRTLLSLIGVGLGVGMGLISTGYVKGEGDLMLRSTANSGVGHIRVAPAGWSGDRDQSMRLQGAANILDALRARQGVTVAAPHTRVDALLAMGTRVVGVQLLGVDPVAEPKVSTLIRTVAEGRYLAADDKGVVVIGLTLAERLDVELDDELMATASGSNGDMTSAMLRIVGIVKTGSREIDGSIAHLMLADAAELSGRAGTAEISLKIADTGQIDAVALALSIEVGGAAEVLRWFEVNPALKAAVDLDAGFNNVTLAVIVLVVLLGVASAQLTAVLERRREFAVLAAVGMRGWQLVRLVLVEGVALGMAGSVAALVVGVPVLYRLKTVGLNLAELSDNMEMAASGVLLEPVIYGDLGWWVLPFAVGLSLTATVIASLYPAWFAARTEPAAALRVGQ